MHRAIILLPLLLGACASTLSDKLDSRYDSAPVVAETRLEWRVYLPPQYHAQPQREFPLLVYFHGGGGNHRTWGARGGLGERLQPLMAAEEFGPFVVLSPSVGRFDPITGQAEQLLFESVIPGVREKYRVSDTTIAFGHSMGGLSALMLALRQPGCFDAVAAASPFAYDVSPFDERARIEAFEKEYGGSFFLGRWQTSVEKLFSDEREFERYSPFAQVRNWRGALPFRLYLTSGTEDYMGLFPQNLLLHEELQRKGLDHEWVVQRGISHSTLADRRIYTWLHQHSGFAATVSGSAGGN
ncbi:MAG: alpha/beta fold hydrolase [Planctomycetes bacterium]|nr:alpha/beta fold hydrolase [Planctomycetota bacterium]MCW8136273.1 alpha/beta fold hydrolase [Planctomycetota bacterium]